MRCSLIVAEMAETLTSQKLMAVGIFADRVVVLNVPENAPEPSPEKPFGHELTLVVTLTEVPEGKHSGHVAVIPPDGGAPVAHMEMASVLGVSGHAVNIIARLTPLIVPSAGRFRVEAKVAGEKAETDFEVRVQRLPGADKAQPPAAAADGTATAKPARARAARKQSTS